MKISLTQSITITISVSAFVLSCLNFALARAADRKRNLLQKRSDQIEVSRLLDNAWRLLYGPDGFTKSHNRSKFDEAQSAVEQALIIDSANVRAVRYRGILYHILDNKLLAKKKYEEALRLNPHDGRAHNCLGLVLEGDEAIAAFRRALECDPNEAMYHYNLAKLLDTLGSRSEADEHFAQAVELEPKNATFLVARARFLKSDKDFREARALYEKAISVESNNVEALVNLGAMIAEGGEWEEGMAWIDHAIRCDPKDSYPPLMIAALHADKKEPEKALELHARAVQLDPTLLSSDDAARDLVREMRQLIEMAKTTPRLELPLVDTTKSSQ